MNDGPVYVIESAAAKQAIYADYRRRWTDERRAEIRAFWRDEEVWQQLICEPEPCNV